MITVVNSGLEVASAAGRYAAVDVYYPSGGGAVAALVVVADPAFATVVFERVVGLAEIEPYRPGAFFRRELPALRAVLADAGRADLLVVDGYVHLDPHGRPGLGAYAHAEFAVPVIGVAKTPFRSATHAIEYAAAERAGPCTSLPSGSKPSGPRPWWGAWPDRIDCPTRCAA